MVVIQDSRGVNVWIEDDLARTSAYQTIRSVEQALSAATEYGLSDEDRQYHLAQLDNAESLLEQTGDLEPEAALANALANPAPDHVVVPPTPVHVPPPDQDEQERRRSERDRRIAEVYAMYLALGQQDDESPVSGADFTNAQLPETENAPLGGAEPAAQKETVGIRHEGELWRVYGRGDDYRVHDYATAEREAKRRVGWT